jgi:hypothetical protein
MRKEKVLVWTLSYNSIYSFGNNAHDLFYHIPEESRRSLDVRA